MVFQYRPYRVIALIFLALAAPAKGLAVGNLVQLLIPSDGSVHREAAGDSEAVPAETSAPSLAFSTPDRTVHRGRAQRAAEDGRVSVLAGTSAAALVLGSSNGPCSTGCLHCSSPSHCNTCAPGYAAQGDFYTGYSCKSCGTGCSYCMSPTKCGACAPGYVAQGDYYTGYTCTPCGADCHKCSSSTTCAVCDNSKYLSGGACVATCPSGTVGSGVASVLKYKQGRVCTKDRCTPSQCLSCAQCTRDVYEKPWSSSVYPKGHVPYWTTYWPCSLVLEKVDTCVNPGNAYQTCRAELKKCNTKDAHACFVVQECKNPCICDDYKQYWCIPYGYATPVPYDKAACSDLKKSFRMKGLAQSTPTDALSSGTPPMPAALETTGGQRLDQDRADEEDEGKGGRVPTSNASMVRRSVRLVSTPARADLDGALTGKCSQ